MYERFFNFRERPFSLSPDPDYLYPSRVHKEALGYLRYGLETHAGFVVITGDIGSGKTTLLQTVLRGLDRQTSVSRLVNTMLDARELVEAVMVDFGLDPPPSRSKPMLLRDLARFLVEQRMGGRLALLVIDEAQNLSMAALEEVRMLSNLETEKSKLIQIALVGQPNLRELLARPELEQLRQRVTVRYHLTALDADETAAYLEHRLRLASLGVPLQFPRPVADLIHRHSRGVPRKINVIADAILFFAYGEDRRTIDVELTRQVVEELESTGVIAAPAATDAALPAAIPSPPPPPSAALDDSLSAREARIVLRERQLAEQQRVLQESDRLIRALQGTTRAASLSEPLPRTAQPSRAMPTRVSPPIARTPPGERPVVSAARHANGRWTRLWRGLVGAAVPVFEEAGDATDGTR